MFLSHNQTKSGGPDDKNFLPNATTIFAGTDVRLHQGRPDLPGKVFPEMAKLAAEKGKRVAVLVCGPAALVSQVRSLCDTMARSRDSPAFDFHAEIFEF